MIESSSMVKRITVEKPLLKLGLTLGEGCVWDTQKQCLYFVDIDECKVFTYDPRSAIVGYERFSKKITSIALRDDGDGLVGTSEDEFIHIPARALPFPPTASLQEYIVINRVPVPFDNDEKRFNDAAVDPAGRLLAGTMGKEHHQTAGKLHVFGPAGEHRALLCGLTCSNGIGWSIDGKRMYFTDSWVKEIALFDYDPMQSACTNRRTFSLLDENKYGEPDGLCMDTEDGVWSARWQSGKVIRLSPSGVIDVEIDFPSAWHVTCVVFGGEKLDKLYVTTAKTDYNNEHLPERSHGGHVFVVENLGYTGLERARFKTD